MCISPRLAEMELMSSSDCRLSSVRQQKRRLQLELQGLDAVQTGEYRSFIRCHVNVVKCKPLLKNVPLPPLVHFVVLLWS